MKLEDIGIKSNLFLGSSGYPSLESLEQSLDLAKSDVLTVSMRRQIGGTSENSRFIDFLRRFNTNILPNTSGCYRSEDAVLVAQMARDVFETNFIKVELVIDERSQHPNPIELIKTVEILVNDGFTVFPYTSDDLGLAKNLVDVGCKILMPGGSPIGSGQGILNPQAIKRMVKNFPDQLIVLDAGIGLPSHASTAMELGCDAVLVNSAIAKAKDPIAMSKAFRLAVDAGKVAYESGPIAPVEDTVASSPLSGKPFSNKTFEILY